MTKKYSFFLIRPAAASVMFKRETVFWKHVSNIRDIDMFLNGDILSLWRDFHIFECFSTREEALWISSLTRGGCLIPGWRGRVHREKRWKETWNWLKYFSLFYSPPGQITLPVEAENSLAQHPGSGKNNKREKILNKQIFSERTITNKIEDWSECQPKKLVWQTSLAKVYSPWMFLL